MSLLFYNAEYSITKLELAKETVKGILDQLGGNDSVSLTLFGTSACLPLPLTPVSCINVTKLKEDISRDVQADGSTNMEAGLRLASDTLSNCSYCHQGLENQENRMILLTDAMPNVGNLSSSSFGGIIQDAAASNIFLTTIGIGVDFNTDLIEHLANVRGANYYSIHTPGEFQKRLVTDFNYTVTPLVFNLTLSVDPSSVASNETNQQGWRILAVYGSPNPNSTAYAAVNGNGTVTEVNTLFPSPKSEEGIKGGVILMRVAAPEQGLNAVPLILDVSYTDRAGYTSTSKRTVKLPAEEISLSKTVPYFQSSGVRKAVLLARYTDLVRNWLIDEWRQLNNTHGNHSVVIPAELCVVFPSEYCTQIQAEMLYNVQELQSGACSLQTWLNPQACILPTPVPVIFQLGEWERQSENLTGHVNVDAKKAISEFLPYMQSEIATLNDSTLVQEEEILNIILKS